MTGADGLPPPRKAPAAVRARYGIRAFRSPPFRILYLAFAARGMQVWVQFVALPLLVLDLGGSAAEVGLVTGLFLIPIAVLAPAAGVVGDFLDRRRTLIVLGGYGAVLGLTLAILVYTGFASIAALAVVAGLFGVLNASEIPIRLAFISEVLPDDDLANGIVHGQMAFLVSRVAGPAIAGGIAATAGLAPLFGLIAALGVATALATFAIAVPYPRPSRPIRPGVAAAALMEGLRYSWAAVDVRRPLILLGSVAIFGMSFQAILPIYAVDQLRIPEHDFGLMLAFMGVGALLASIPLAFVRPVRARTTMVIGAALVAATVGALAVTDVASVAFPLAAVAGAAGNLFLGSVSIVLQDTVDGDVRARVLGLQAALFQGGLGIGGLAMGLATESVGLMTTMATGAVIVGLATVGMWLLGAAVAAPRLEGS